MITLAWLLAAVAVCCCCCCLLLPPVVLCCAVQVTVLNHLTGSRQVSTESDPLDVPVQLSRNWQPAAVEGVPEVFTGGWVGYAGYDTVRYVYGSEWNAVGSSGVHPQPFGWVGGGCEKGGGIVV